MKTIRLNHGRFALVDDQDFDRLNKFKWHVTVSGYVARMIRNASGKQSTVYMHRDIIATPPGSHTDHANADKLDNRRSNIRVCTASQNGGNRKPSRGHKFKGVTWDSRDKKWRATIIHQKTRHNLGKHQTAELAARAYDAASIRLFGSFARLNFSA